MLNGTLLFWILFLSNTHNVDPYLVTAIIETESSFNADATGLIGEIGLMQIRKEYLKKEINYYDPINNLKAGIPKLASYKRLQNKLGDYWFCSWNLGPTGALRYNKAKGLKNFRYCKKVINAMSKYKNKKIYESGYFNVALR